MKSFINYSSIYNHKDYSNIIIFLEDHNGNYIY